MNAKNIQEFVALKVIEHLDESKKNKELLEHYEKILKRLSLRTNRDVFMCESCNSYGLNYGKNQCNICDKSFCDKCTKFVRAHRGICQPNCNEYRHHICETCKKSNGFSECVYGIHGR